MGVATTHEGMDGLTRMDVWPEIGIVFDATSAGAHKQHSEVAVAAGKMVIDLTPAAIGPYVIPVVNGDAHLDAPNVNMVTCGGQATIPIVAAVSQVATVHYAEIVASISSQVGRPRHARQYRRVHRDDVARASRRSAAPTRARRSSSSTRPSRR